MEIKMVKIAEINPAQYNPRLATEKDFSELKESVKKYGLVDPVILNENPERFNILIGGHFRLKVAQELGYTEIPAVYVSLDEAAERELNLRLNKNVGRWDYDMLANNFDNGLLLQVGFSEIELGLANKDPKDLVDKDNLANTMGTYLDGNIRQIVLYFKKEEFEAILPRMEAAMKHMNVSSHSEAFIKMLEHYENTGTPKTEPAA